MKIKITKSRYLREVQVKYKRGKKVPKPVRITSSEHCFQIFRKLFDRDKIEYVEDFVMLLLDRKNEVTGWARISSGGTHGTVVDAKVIFQIAIKANASGIIVCHNHPSGNITPSTHDKKLTEDLVTIGKMLEIYVFDHLIISDDKYFSFADNKLIK